MAGQFSRTGKQRAMNTALSIGGPSGSNLGDQVAAVSTAISAGTTGTTSLATATVTTTRSIPSGSVIICSSTTGTNVESYTTSGSTASGATSITVVSQTSNKARASGDLIWVLQVPQPYVAMNSTAPTDSALGTEYGAGGYARQPVTWTLPTAADPTATQNTALLTFGPFPSGTGATLSNASLMDALSGGTASNMMAWWGLTANKTPGTNDSLTVAAAALTSTWQTPG